MESTEILDYNGKLYTVAYCFSALYFVDYFKFEIKIE